MEADNNYKAAVSIDPMHSASRIRLARSAMSRDELDSGREHINKVLSMPDVSISGDGDTKSSSSANVMMMAQYLLGESLQTVDAHKAIEAYQASIGLDRKCGPCLFALGAMFASLGKYNRANDALQEVVVLGDQVLQFQARLAWGVVALHLDNFDLALKNFNVCLEMIEARAVGKDATLQSIYLNDPEYSMQMYLFGVQKDLIRSDPNILAVLLNNIAVTYFRMGRTSKAIDAMTHSINTSPSMPLIYRNMARILAAVGESRPSVAYLDHADALDAELSKGEADDDGGNNVASRYIEVRDSLVRSPVILEDKDIDVIVRSGAIDTVKIVEVEEVDSGGSWASMFIDTVTFFGRRKAPEVTSETTATGARGNMIGDLSQPANTFTMDVNGKTKPINITAAAAASKGASDPFKLHSASARATVANVDLNALNGKVPGVFNTYSSPIFTATNDGMFLMLIILPCSVQISDHHYL